MALKALNLSSATLKDDFESAMKNDCFKFSSLHGNLGEEQEEEDEFEEIGNFSDPKTVPTLQVNGKEITDSNSEKVLNEVWLLRKYRQVLLGNKIIIFLIWIPGPR